MKRVDSASDCTGVSEHRVLWFSQFNVYTTKKSEVDQQSWSCGVAFCFFTREDGELKRNGVK